MEKQKILVAISPVSHDLLCKEYIFLLCLIEPHWKLLPLVFMHNVKNSDL